MAVLIEGMEMPTEGYIDVRIFCDGTASFAIAKNPYFKEVEAIPVPEPHGRLIDADALADSFEPSDFWNPDAEDNCFAAVCIVHSASTVIPASEEG